MKVSTNQFSLNMIDERLIWFLLIVILSIASCDSSSDREDYKGITGLIENLPELPGPYEYSMWLYENDNSRQMTTFNADSEGIFRLASAPQSMFIEDASEIIVSIENGDEEYKDPSVTQILGARFSSSDEADFKTYPIAGDFSLAQAAFLTSENENFQLAKLNFKTGPNNWLIDLPALDEGWIYEMWVESNGDYSSLRRFQDTSIPEVLYYDAGLLDKNLMISVEPVADYSDDPSGIFLFSKRVQGDVFVEEMESLIGELPSGVINKEK